ncbi:AglZ/HisF2 family acetamidino modification protein [Devosia sp. CAU 1758]
MLRPRIIPTLLIHKGGLYKTQKFGSPKYVGDPINAVRIFNEKEVDELIVLDIDATREGRPPNYKVISALATECRMPLCYGGGVSSSAQVGDIIQLGVEKIAMSAAAVARPELISEAAATVGSQSIAVVLDVKRGGLLKKYDVVTHNATKRTGIDPVVFAQKLEALGAGEIVVNSVDHDGEMKGYDIDLITRMRNAIHLPMTVLGGAGSLADIERLIGAFGIVGAAAGSLFVFKGKYRAVLINYPNPVEREQLLMRAGIAA